MQANLKLVTTFAKNFWRARIRGNTLVDPLGVTWHATNACNFRCNYCDDGKGHMYPDIKGVQTMKTDEVKHVLGLAREKVSLLYITGGEPLVRKDLTEIVRWAKQDAKYSYIGITTNGVLLHRQEGILEHVDALVISMDSTDDARYDGILNVGTGASAAIKDSIRRYAALRKKHKYALTVSCVIMPGLIQHARDVMQFCFDNELHFASMPQSIGPYPHPELRNNAEYVAFIDELVAYKKKGYPVWGSYPYFKTVRDFEHFQCYPTTAPRIFPNGDLMYPCSPLDKVAGNLKGAKSFDEVYLAGIEKHGGIPECDARCFASCYVETSHTMNFPASIIWEHFDLWNRVRRLVMKARRSRPDDAELPEIHLPDGALPPEDDSAGPAPELVQIRSPATNANGAPVS
jgi:MoaA/NifB/PqqE/SkfB family radical SAM enzyme